MGEANFYYFTCLKFLGIFFPVFISHCFYLLRGRYNESDCSYFSPKSHHKNNLLNFAKSSSPNKTIQFYTLNQNSIQIHIDMAAPVFHVPSFATSKMAQHSQNQKTYGKRCHDENMPILKNENNKSSSSNNNDNSNKNNGDGHHKFRRPLQAV